MRQSNVCTVKAAIFEVLQCSVMGIEALTLKGYNRLFDILNDRKKFLLYLILVA